MQALAGILFIAALTLAVIFGGQTLDFCWGPALVFLAPAVLLSLSGLRQLRERGAGAWTAVVLLAVAWGWILYGCAYSPVKEFGRSDALLVAGMVLAFLFGLLLQPSGKSARIVMAGISLLGLANTVLVLMQVRDASFTWPFSVRPSYFPSGFFSHYNHMADFSSVAALLLIARFFFAKDTRGERIFQALGVVALLISVFCSKSRGSLIGLAAGVELIAIAAFLVALRERRKNARVFALIPFAVLVFGAISATVMLSSFESARGVEQPGTQRFADNRSRLVLMGMALRVSGDHPISGGGARSFGWQKYATWNSDPSAQEGKLPTNDDFAHNEFLQTAVDYGWVGAGLVLVAVVTAGLTGVAGLVLRDEESRAPRFANDATVIGGLAAMASTLVNSNFSFVTHTIPGAIYLGFALALVLPRRTPPPVAYTRRLFSAIPVTLAALAVAIPVLWLSITASRAYFLTWPVSNTDLAVVAPNEAADKMKQAAELWPSSFISNTGGQICQAAAGRRLTEQADIVPYLHRAVGFYEDAARAYPFSPRWPLNRGNVLVSLSKDDVAGPMAQEAEEAFQTALKLQGGMEGLLRVRYYYGQYLIYRWDTLWRTKRRAEEAFVKFHEAKRLLEEAKVMTEPYIQLNQITDLLDQVNAKIQYLEGAGFTLPAADAQQEGR